MLWLLDLMSGLCIEEERRTLLACNLNDLSCIRTGCLHPRIFYQYL